MTSDDETLRQFVPRARRIAAHSLFQDAEVLRTFAQAEFRGYIDLAGRMTLTLGLPENEEVFESLAARVRPLTLKREPVHYAKVLAAIDRAIAGSGASEELRGGAQRLRAAWEAAEVQGTEIRAYGVQTARVDGSEVTRLVSDVQLAAAWMYADLVHTSASGPKAEALAFPLRERYTAGVRLFSHLALLTVATLRLVEKLCEEGVLAIDRVAWEEDVVVGPAEPERDVRVFVAPVETATPDMRDSPGLGDEWSAFTVTSLLRLDPANQVEVVLTDGDGGAIANHDAAVSRRELVGTTAEWDVLVGNCATFKFAFDVEDDQIVAAHFLGWETHELTNELILAATALKTELHHAVTMAFRMAGTDFVNLGPPEFGEAVVQQLDVIAHTLADIVAIEHMTGKRLDPCIGKFDDRDRVWLRRARLMFEGQVVHGPRLPVQVTSPNGRLPQAIVSAASTRDVGGAKVPMPSFYMRHAGMTAKVTSEVTKADGDARTYAMYPPEGEAFFAWAPDRVAVVSNMELAVTAMWGLPGIDEGTFVF